MSKNEATDENAALRKKAEDVRDEGLGDSLPPTSTVCLFHY
jgi:hypothetical protein